MPTSYPLLVLALLIAVVDVSARPALVKLAPVALVLSQDGIPCAETPSKHRNGRIKHCTLTREHRIGAQLLPPGSEVYHDETGALAEVVLGAEAAFSGQVLPAKASVFFERDGRMRFFWLHEDADIQGHRIWGHEDGAGNRLHPNGTVRAIWLAGDQEIDGIPCTTSGNVLRLGMRVMSLGTKRMAWFHDNGRLQQAMLSRDAVIQGHAFKKGDLISLRRDGTLDLAAPKRG